VLTSNLHRQGYREVKLHVLHVGVMGTTYKDHTDLWQTSIWIAIRLKRWHLADWTLHQTCIYTHKNTLCTAIQPKQQQSWCGSGCYGTQPPWPTLFFCLFARWGVAWWGHLCNPLPWPCWLCHHYQYFFYSALVFTTSCVKSLVPLSPCRTRSHKSGT
jgi:hypothetical protein